MQVQAACQYNAKGRGVQKIPLVDLGVGEKLQAASDGFTPEKGAIISDVEQVKWLRSQLESQPDARILVSACLMGSNVRYDGGNCLQSSLKELVEQGKAIPVCPEMLGGLPTPRIPSESVGGDGLAVLNGSAKVLTKSGDDVSSQFVRGANLALNAALGAAPQGRILFAVLKSKSPSCGVGKIYDGNFAGGVTAGDGVATSRFRQAGIPVISSDTWQLAFGK